MLLYNPAMDEGFFVDEFLEGLREEIRAIHLHRPSNLDAASLLALLQEEELDNMQRKYSSRLNYKEPQRYGSNFSSTPDKITKDTASTGKADDDTRTEHTKWEDKLDTLKSYRRSKGLCFTCGEKWNRTHKCPAHVPLHVIEELLELLPITNSKSDLGSDTEDDADEVLLISSVSPPNKATKKATIRLHGVVGKRQIRILVDSGSVSSFISTSLATELGCDTHELRPETFKVADGRAIQCTQFVPDFEWGVQGHTFRHSLNALNLGCYDMILGADWLHLHSPMWVHWRKQILRFTHNNRRITLRGVQSTPPKCGLVKLKKLRGLLRQGVVSQIMQILAATPSKGNGTIRQVATTFDTLLSYPAVVQQLLTAFRKLFQEPPTLPPSRPQDHQIPLLPGAQPVQVRPYRYTPLHQKAFVKLMGLQFRIQYKQGSANLAADALSRQHASISTVQASTVQPVWMENLQAGYDDDAQARTLLTELSVTGANGHGYTLRDGLIRDKNRVWVGNNPLAQGHILQALHSSGMGGHSGVHATYPRVKQYFAWPKLKLAVQDFVAQCQVCQKAKTEQVVRAQQRIKMQADKRLSDRTFSVGDQVFLKLQLHMQQSVEARGNQKLPFKYCGPFKILQQFGEVAYKLQLPPSSHIHPVVHVSQLKHHVPANAQVCLDVSILESDFVAALVPEQILERALIFHQATTVTRIQVCWSGPMHA